MASPDALYDGPSGSWRYMLLRLLVTAVTLAAASVVVLVEPNGLPLTTACHVQSCAVTAIKKKAGVPALRTGDEIVLAQQSFATRAVLLANNVPGDRGYTFLVRRGTSSFRVQLHTISSTQTSSSRSVVVTRIVIVFICLFGLLMLWKGDTAASRGLCVFALSTAVTAGLYTWPLAPPWNLISQGVGTLLGGPAAFMGLYLTADALVRSDAHSRSARTARRAYLAMLLLLYVSEVVPQLLLVAGRDVPFYVGIQLITLILGIVGWIVPLIYLLKGYKVSSPESRLRIRWFIVSIALLLPLLVCNLLLQSGNRHFVAHEDVIGGTQVVLTIAVFTILSYAALSQRLVAVRFALNRALVFGILTASLIGALSLLESLIERSVISREAGLALDLVVPLLLGVSIHRIHRWGEESVERVIFRNEYRARSAINAFLRDAGFISQPGNLFERTVQVFALHSGGCYSALYLAEKSDYARVGASERAQGLPKRVMVDDVAMVRLRATLAPVDLFALSSALGPSGLALPLVVRGKLEGVLICGAKAEGRYAQAEVDFLSNAAAGIASCIVALKAELHGHFVGQVAAGALPMERIVEEARSLAGIEEGMA